MYILGHKNGETAQNKEYISQRVYVQYLEGKWEGGNPGNSSSIVRASTTVEGCQAGGLGHQFQYMREYRAGNGSILL